MGLKMPSSKKMRELTGERRSPSKSRERRLAEVAWMVARDGDSWRAYIQGGRTPTDLDGVEWAAEMALRGAGEILLTSMDRDGVRTGYDIELTRRVVNAVSVPVIASGGAGAPRHLREAFRAGGASAALLAGILHDGLTTVVEIKRTLAGYGVQVR